MRIPHIDIEGASAATKGWRAAMASFRGLTGGGRVQANWTASGPVLRLSPDGRRWIRLGGAANPYTATPVQADAGGAWTDLPGGTDSGSAYEANGVTGLNMKVVYADPTPQGDWRFTFRRQGGTDPGIFLPGCPCTSLPVTLHQTMTGTDSTELFQPCTYTWQVNPFGGGLTNYYSESFPERGGVHIHGDFHYRLACGGGAYVVFSENADSTGTGALWRWVPGFFGNTCSPFRMLHGSSLAGSGYNIYDIKVQV